MKYADPSRITEESLSLSLLWTGCRVGWNGIESAYLNVIGDGQTGQPNIMLNGVCVIANCEGGRPTEERQAVKSGDQLGNIGFRRSR